MFIGHWCLWKFMKFFKAYLSIFEFNKQAIDRSIANLIEFFFVCCVFSPVSKALLKLFARVCLPLSLMRQYSDAIHRPFDSLHAIIWNDAFLKYHILFENHIHERRINHWLAFVGVFFYWVEQFSSEKSMTFAKPKIDVHSYIGPNYHWFIFKITGNLLFISLSLNSTQFAPCVHFKWLNQNCHINRRIHRNNSAKCSIVTNKINSDFCNIQICHRQCQFNFFLNNSSFCDLRRCIHEEFHVSTV